MEQILFPVDFSEPCDAVAPAVSAMARAFGASVTMIHVVQPPRLQTELGPYQHHFKTIMEEIAGSLAEYQRPLWDGLKVDSILRSGSPSKEIVEFGEAQRVDLVMMPTRGWTRFRQLLLGSVTASVLHDTSCPVWTTAHTDRLHDVQPYRSIVCAVDLGETTPAVLRMAGDLAARFQAPVQVLHAVAPGERAAAIDAAIVQISAMAAKAGLPAKTGIEVRESHGVVDTVIAEEEKHGADLLVIGRGTLQGPLGRLRTNAHNLIRLSRCPVLSV